MGVRDPGAAGDGGLSDLDSRGEFGEEALHSRLFLCASICLTGQVGRTENDSGWIDVQRGSGGKHQRKINNTAIAANAHRTVCVRYGSGHVLIY